LGLSETALQLREVIKIDIVILVKIRGNIRASDRVHFGLLGCLRALVANIAYLVTILVGLGEIGIIRAVVCNVWNTIVVRVGGGNSWFDLQDNSACDTPEVQFAQSVLTESTDLSECRPAIRLQLGSMIL
jgi:hypothetical protein